MITLFFNRVFYTFTNLYSRKNKHFHTKAKVAKAYPWRFEAFA